MRSANNPNLVTRGMILIIATALMISLQDLVFKLFKGDLTLWQIFALRGVMTVPLLALIGVIRARSLKTVRHACEVWPLIRGLCLTMTFLAFYAAIPFLSLSTVGAANYIAPIFVAILSAFVIKEAVGAWGWIGVFLGFVGVVVLLQPGTDAFSPFALLPILGAAFYSVGLIITRTKCQSYSVESLALSLNAMMMFAGFTLTFVLVLAPLSQPLVAQNPYLLGNWNTVALSDWLALAALTGFAILIGVMHAGAYQIAPPATVATFEYSYLVFVAAWDILFFETLPTATTILGMVLIVGAGLLVMQGKPKSS